MNGRCPASSSNNRTPAAYTSDRASTGAAFTCSGDMYAGVPNTTPTFVRFSAMVREADPSRNFAIPKSSSRT